MVVKGHSAHPGTGEIVAEAIKAAIEATGMPKGVFSLIQGGKRDVGTALVQHPLIKAVGFTPPEQPVDLAHQGHFGLMGMRERALLYGGQLTITSAPGQGAIITARLPLLH